MTNLDSRGMVDTIYLEDHKTLLYTKYMMVIERLFKVFPIICLRVIDPQGRGQFSHTKYISCGPRVFRRFFMFSPLQVIDPHG